MDEITARLARFSSGVRFEDLPASIVRKTKEVLLDSIGCALGGYVTERGKIAVELGEMFGVTAEATVIGYRKLSCPAASFVNGELINALDFDPIGPVSGHTAPFVIPSVLAVAERAQASGRELLTAAAIALEIGGRAVGSVARYTEGQRYSYNSTIFGAVAGACRLLRLNEAETRSAFGIGGTSTPIPGARKWLELEAPSNFNLKYGTWAGWVAMLGTVAALAAQKGFKGDSTILDGEYGYWQMYGSSFFRGDFLVGDLGRLWHLEEARIKPYPACYFDACAITAVERLVRENNIRPEEIDEIILYNAAIGQTPQRFPAEVSTNEDAQFSHAYLLAMAACYEGKPGPQWQLPSSLADPIVRGLMPKVKVKLHPRAEEIVAERVAAGKAPVFHDALCVISARGRKFTLEVSAPKGSPSDPMTEQEVGDKFRQNAQFSLLKKEKVERAIETIWKLDELDCVAQLTSLLTVGD